MVETYFEITPDQMGKALAVFLIFFIFKRFLDFLGYLLGKSLYKFGYYRFGHYLVAMSECNPSWLVSHCPYIFDGKCRAWTCPAYCKEGQTFCKKYFYFSKR